VHFDFKPARTEDDDGVWVSAAACMRNYLILREKARAFRADPEVIAALAAARVEQLALPTLGAGETWRDVRDFAPDLDALGARGMAFEHLDQLALEHLYGVR
jgi:xylose isomerase